jgi:hypothetical protein
MPREVVREFPTRIRYAQTYPSPGHVDGSSVIASPLKNRRAQLTPGKLTFLRWITIVIPLASIWMVMRRSQLVWFPAKQRSSASAVFHTVKFVSATEVDTEQLALQRR